MIYIVLSIVLITCQVIILVFPFIYRMPIEMNAAALISLGILGLHWLLYHDKTGIHVFGIILMFFVIFIGFMSLVSTYTVLIGADSARNRKPVVFGAGGDKSIAIVYHPGGSGFQKRINTLIADKLALKGFRVTLYTASPSLKIDPKEVSAIILSSPVYGGKPRPPFVDFINNAGLKGVKCYVILSGWFTDINPEMKETMTGRMKQLIESRGGIFIGYRKFSAFVSDLDKESLTLTESLAEKIIEAVENYFRGRSEGDLDRCSAMPGGTLGQLRKIFRKNGFDLNAGFLIREDFCLEEKIEMSLIKFERKITGIKPVRLDKNCDLCGVCARICLRGNIRIEDKRMTWNRDCEMCYGCFQWCPREAIHLRSGMDKKAGYHHPEIILNDVILR